MQVKVRMAGVTYVGTGRMQAKGGHDMADEFSQIITRSGLVLRVRPARPDDEAALADFFAQVTAEDRRFRFLSMVRIGHEHIVAMTSVDHQKTESFVAFGADDRVILGAAMLACDPDLAIGEVAISVRGDHKNLGIGWALLRHVETYARAKGVRRLMSVENRANKSAIQIEQEHGFDASSLDGDMTLVVLQKDLAA